MLDVRDNGSIGCEALGEEYENSGASGYLGLVNN